MAVPKQRKTKSRRNNRRMHLFAKAPVLTRCQKCSQPVLAFTVCMNCGYYKGEEIIDVMKKLTKKEKKKRAKEMATEEKKEGKEKPLTMEGMSRK